jgi:hypothetical protein
VPANTLPFSADTERANRGQNSPINNRVQHHSASMTRRSPSNQRPGDGPHLSFPPQQWLAASTLTDGKETNLSSSSVLTATTVVGWAQADKEDRGQNRVLTCRVHHHSAWLIPRRPNRDQITALSCRARHLSGWLGPRRPNEKRQKQLPQFLCPPPQWLNATTPNKRTQSIAAPSTIVPATTVPG